MNHLAKSRGARGVLFVVLLAPRIVSAEPDSNIPAVSDLIGKWECVTPGRENSSLEIDYDPADPKREKLICRGAKDWSFDPNIDLTETGLVWLIRKPAASEMNPNAPEWARKEVEGKLGWKLRLTATKGGSGGDALTLRGQFFPGKIIVTGGKVRLATGAEADEGAIDLEFQKLGSKTAQGAAKTALL